MYQALTGCFAAGAIALLYFLVRARAQVKAVRDRFSGVVSLEDEIAVTKRRLEAVETQQKTLETENAQKRLKLTKEYEDALTSYTSLKKELSLLEENANDISFGLYKPHFNFQSSEEYKVQIEKIRIQERDLIRTGAAARCGQAWTVNNDKRQGQRMANQYTKLLLRAFNGECDAAVTNVSWNNITKMEERVRKSYDAINQLGSVMQMAISSAYMNLKLDEIRLSYEYEEKKHQEKEEQRRIREQIRDEEQAQRELDKAREDAERSEAEYQKLLTKAQAEALKATGAQLQKLTEQIGTFEAKLDEARKKKERAIARAQLTKSGFVYVISNIGSFGDGIFKIGMTRRLEPMDRVIELGDASVPFAFDLHAMLYSDNAPDLENALHKHFAGRELNLVNHRKEFYQDIKLREVEEFVKNRGLSAQFVTAAEAKEYRESLALRAQQALVGAESKHAEEELTFPAALFATPAC